MAKKKHQPAHKPQQPHKAAHHLPKVGSPEQHEWDERARNEVVTFGAWWVAGALAIATLIAVLVYFL